MATPTLPGVQPLPQLLSEVRESQVEVLGRTDLGSRPGDFGPRIDEFLGIQRAATVLALVAARLGIVAMGASTLDVAVG